MRDTFPSEELSFHETYTHVMLCWDIKGKSTINWVQSENQGNVKQDKLLHIHFREGNVKRQPFN